MSGDWWSKKLQPTQPAGLTLPAAQPQPVYQNQQPVYQQHQPQPVQQQVPIQQPVNDDPNRKLSLREAVSRFSGGEGRKTEGHLSCPSCGSHTGYTQFSGMGGLSAGVMGNRPAPHCFECGYNGKFAQGMESTWA